MIRKVEHPDKRGWDWLDDENDRLYTRLIASISWPMDKPGALIILAEERDRHHTIHVLHSSVHTDLSQLLEVALEKSVYFKCVKVLAPQNEDTERFTQHWNSKRDQKRFNTLSVERTPFYRGENLDYALHVLKSALSGTIERLVLTGHAELRSALNSVPMGYELQGKDYPQVAALANGVVALVDQPYRPPSHTVELTTGFENRSRRSRNRRRDNDDRPVVAH